LNPLPFNLVDSELKGILSIISLVFKVGVALLN